MQISAHPASFLIAFGAGVTASLSPCVYPFIPIMLSFIGVKAATTRFRALSLTLVYAAGLCLTYSVLGTAAALSGKVFASFAQNGYLYLALANIYLFLGLGMLDVFKIDLSGLKTPGFISRFSGLTGAFLLGAFSGLLISPCVTPMLAAILVFIAKERSIVLGVGLLSSFALGLCLILILVGIFGSFLYRLPKSGNWNRRLKKLAGFILIIAAQYFLLKAGALL